MSSYVSLPEKISKKAENYKVSLDYREFPAVLVTSIDGVRRRKIRPEGAVGRKAIQALHPAVAREAREVLGPGRRGHRIPRGRRRSPGDHGLAAARGPEGA